MRLTRSSCHRSTPRYRIVSNTVAQAPLLLYRRTDDGAKEIVRDHPMAMLLNAPNPLHTNFRLRKVTMAQILARGFGLWVKVGKRGGPPQQLLPVHPSRVKVEASESDEFELRYRISAASGRPRGEERVLQQHDVVTFLGESIDGIAGLSSMDKHRNIFALGIGTERQGSKLFKNAMQSSGMFKHPKGLKDEAYDRPKKSLVASHQGVDNAFGVLLLEDGLEWVKTGFTAEESQFLETRKFQVVEVARVFGVPPHLLFDLDRATFSNIEHQSLEFVKYFIQPWWEEWEQQLTRQLLNAKDLSDGLFFEHDASRLLRGDTKAVTDQEIRHAQWGIRTPNEIRRDHNWPPLPGGDERYPPPNTAREPEDDEKPAP